MKVGDVCVKLAGRDAGKKCVIVSIEKDGFVMIDGATRRRKCNPRHLEPLNIAVKLKANASHDEVVGVLVAEGVEVVTKKTINTKEKKEKSAKIQKKRTKK